MHDMHGLWNSKAKGLYHNNYLSHRTTVLLIHKQEKPADMVINFILSRSIRAGKAHACMHV